jgi:hypothetical protein
MFFRGMYFSPPSLMMALTRSSILEPSMYIKLTIYVSLLEHKSFAAQDLFHPYSVSELSVWKKHTLILHAEPVHLVHEVESFLGLGNRNFCGTISQSFDFND